MVQGVESAAKSKACRMKVMKEVIKKFRSKGSLDANNTWWVSELLAADCEKKRGSIQDGKILCCDGTIGCTK